jgi:predicted kinase
MSHHLVHLITGSTGAGKTTYALQLSDRLEAVRFSIDEWMTALFWMDSPSPIEASWSMERVARCSDQIWATAAQVVARGVACVLDLGFTRLRERSQFVSRARNAGLSVQLHFLDVAPEERWRRVLLRNAEKGATHQLEFAITRELFDFVETLWEPPTDREMADCSGVLVTNGSAEPPPRS